jgi:hypothetical protein
MGNGGDGCGFIVLQPLYFIPSKVVRFDMISAKAK